MLEKTYQLIFLGSPLILVAIAHGVCIRYDLFSQLKRPLDLGMSFRERRIFGDHKTWRVLLLNMAFCTVGTIIQTWLQSKDYLPDWLFLLDYKKYGYLLGLLLGFGMTFGELPNSFLKRQLGIPPGEKKRGFLGLIFFLFDQIDLTLGIWLFIFFLISPTLSLVLLSLPLTFVLHLTISSIGYLLGMRKTVL